MSSLSLTLLIFGSMLALMAVRVPIAPLTNPEAHRPPSGGGAP